MKHPDVLVIGGGVIGICTAYFLARTGRKVTVLDQGSIGGGSSFANAGLIVPSHATPLPRPGVVGAGLKWLLDPGSPFYIRPRLDPDLFSWLWRFFQASRPAQTHRGLRALAALSAASADLCAELVESERLDCHYERAGLLLPCRTEAGFEEEIKDAARLRDVGIRAEVLTGEEAARIERVLRPELPGAVYCPDDAHLDPQAFVAGLASRAESLGAALCPDQAVRQIRRTGQGQLEVETAAEVWSPACVVLSAGAWTSPLARQADVRLPVQPAKGYSLTYPAGVESPQKPMLLVEDRVAVTPLGDRLRLAGTLEFTGLDLTLSPRRLDAVAEAPPRYFSKQQSPTDAAQAWAGLRPVTPDGLPLIGPVAGAENLLVATGHAMLGMALGPITGKLVSEMVNKETLSLDVSPYQADRFGV